MMRLLDLYCGAGGAAMGYHQAGFTIVGVDTRPQPHYPFRVHQADALTFPTSGFDAIHASPPCQAYSNSQRIRNREHPDLVAPTRTVLEASGLPWVIENVPGSPLIDPVVLEGQMFPELRVQRTRWFETNWPLDVPFLRGPRPGPQVMMGRPLNGDEWHQPVGNFSDVRGARRAMGIDWMTRDELRDAIPPAYTRLIGEQLMSLCLKSKTPGQLALF